MMREPENPDATAAAFTPLVHPAVWLSDTLRTRDDFLREWPSGSGAELAAGRVSPAVANLLREIQVSLEEGCGCVLLRGLDLDPRAVDVAERLFLRMGHELGTPLSQTAEGDLLFSVRDAGFTDDDPRSRGPNTRRKLSFHSDRCDVIGFLCLQQARSGGENLLVSSMALYNEIGRQRPELLRVLMQPFYYKRHTVDPANPNPFCQQPVFSFTDGHFASSLLRVLIDRAYADPQTPAMTELQREALDFVETLADDPAFHVRLTQEPGDILLLNNWVTLHRRTAFEDYADPARKRHLLRLWLAMPNSRPIDPLFRDNYGATAAGAVRGGMRTAASPGNPS